MWRRISAYRTRSSDWRIEFLDTTGFALFLLPIESVHAAEGVELGDEYVAMLVHRDPVRRGDNARTPFQRLDRAVPFLVRPSVGAEYRSAPTFFVENRNLAA